MSEAQTINNIRDLAEHYCYRVTDPGDRGDGLRPCTAEEAEARNQSSIAKSLFKYTECGVSFWSDGKTVVVAGYCEGCDKEHERYAFDFPFDLAAFEKVVSQADADGVETWNESHGCPGCVGLGADDDKGYEEALEAAQSCGEWGVSVNPDCKSCNGHGIVI